MSNARETGSGRREVSKLPSLLHVETKDQGDQEPGAVNQEPVARSKEQRARKEKPRSQP